MSFDPSHLLSQLTALKREDGDIRLTCDGIVIKAHSYILSLRLGPMIISFLWLADNCQILAVRSDNCQIRQLSVGTKVSGDNCQWRQLSVGTAVSGPTVSGNWQ